MHRCNFYGQGKAVVKIFGADITRLYVQKRPLFERFRDKVAVQRHKKSPHVAGSKDAM
jgi:hypothetical protein